MLVPSKDRLPWVLNEKEKEIEDFPFSTFEWLWMIEITMEVGFNTSPPTFSSPPVTDTTFKLNVN